MERVQNEIFKLSEAFNFDFQREYRFSYNINLIE